MEDVVEGLFKILARAILYIARGVVWIAWEFMREKFLWYLGWPVCKVMTFGKLPRVRIGNVDDEHLVVFTLVIAIGFTLRLHKITYFERASEVV